MKEPISITDFKTLTAVEDPVSGLRVNEVS